VAVVGCSMPVGPDAVAIAAAMNAITLVIIYSSRELCGHIGREPFSGK
jgi:hypothetical protein